MNPLKEREEGECNGYVAVEAWSLPRRRKYKQCAYLRKK
jgi:hypothetical protein